MEKLFDNALGNLVLNQLFDEQFIVSSRQWQPLRDGVNISPIYEMDEMGPRAAFLHYLPGASVPNHVHQGIEHILILHGSQIDGEVTYTSGTLIVHGPETNHNIHSPEGCLALGIWEKPVRFV